MCGIDIFKCFVSIGKSAVESGHVADSARYKLPFEDDTLTPKRVSGRSTVSRFFYF